MNAYKVLDKLVEEGNGYLSTRDAVQHNVSKYMLSKYVKERNMEHIRHGMYLTQEGWDDELYEVSRTNLQTVFSHETALNLHGLMEREPKWTTVTVKKGYNATHLRKKGLKVYQEKPEFADFGITTIETRVGHVVRVYDMERTICDIIRSKKEMDVQIFQYAMKEYLMSPDKDLCNLILYARKFNIEDTVLLYTEILL